jgi:hypothetical protein
MPGGQTSHFILPSAEMGAAHLTQVMNNVYFKATGIVLLLFPVIVAITAPVMIQQLDKATAQQCRTHDWPVTVHQVHIDWCADNGYVTN